MSKFPVIITYTELKNLEIYQHFASLSPFLLYIRHISAMRIGPVFLTARDTDALAIKDPLLRSATEP